MRKAPLATCIAAAAGAAAIVLTPVAAHATDMATVAPIEAHPGESVRVRPVIAGNAQGLMTFTVPAGATISRVVNNAGSTQPCTYDTERTTARCGATNSHWTATAWLVAVVDLDPTAKPIVSTGNVTVQRAANDTGRVAFDVDYPFTILTPPPVVEGVTFSGDARPVVNGTGIPGLTVDVTALDGHTVLGTAEVATDGAFSVTLPAGTEGEVIVRQHDGVGNGSAAVGVSVPPVLDTPLVDPAVAGGAGVVGLLAVGAWLLRRRLAA